MRRFFLILAFLLATVLVAVSVVSFVLVRKPFPDTTGEVSMSGLRSSVTVLRDDYGIPQIFADHPSDLFYAQGYVHAQDRFYEMDFRRHVTSGRLAELVGKNALDTDKFVRTMGWRKVAEEEVAALDTKTKRLLNAYSRGVNAYIDGKSGSELSLEYTVLSITGPDYRPEPWTAADSVAWIKAMAWDLRSNMADEVTRALSTKNLSIKQVEELYPDYPADHATIAGGVASAQERCAPEAIDCSEDLARAALGSLSAAQQAAQKLPSLLGTGDGIGSNSWVVDGQRSATGKPILANDPHLAASMPGIWYQVGLHCRTVTKECPYNVSGFSFSGLPGVVVGHNDSIAWGVTTMYADVTDLYLEKINGDTYEYEGRSVPLKTREETFNVAGGEPETITVRSTRHGPILSDLDADLAEVGTRETPHAAFGDYAVALRWAALTPRPTIKAVFALNTAQNWSEFRKAAELFTVPSQNLVYADVHGNIGYQAPGAIPIRGKGDGRWPVPGWVDDYEWDGYIPFEELPSVYNPDEGFIVTANNKVIGDDYPHLLGADTAAGYRSERIRDLLRKKSKLDVADMQRIQLDAYSENAAQLVPLLLKLDVGSTYYRQGQDTLRGWDYQQDADSNAAAYFNAVWKNLLALTFHDELPEEQWPDGGERWFNVVASILDKPKSHWWDDVTTPGVIETREDILIRAMREARDELTRIRSRDPQKWAWGSLHTLSLVNATLGDSGIGLVEAIFNRGPFKVGGGSGIVNATGWDARKGYEVTSVPSMRMVLDLSDWDRSTWIQLTGNSGHAFHSHYLDQAPKWVKGEYLPWLFTPAKVKTASEDELVLRPQGSS